MIYNYDDINKALNKLDKVRIAVIGDVMLDKYYYGDVERISEEAPIPIVHVESEKNILGGAANVANSLSVLGCKVFLCGVVGKDSNGDKLKSLLKERDINLNGIYIDEKRSTTTKVRIIGIHQQMIRLDFEDRFSISEAVEDVIKKWVDQILEKDIKAVLISDYAKGLCTQSLCNYIINKCLQKKVWTIVDPKGKQWNKYKNANIVTPNLRELSDAWGQKLENINNDIEFAGNKILNSYHIKNLVVTRSEKGLSLLNNCKNLHVPSFAKEVFDVSGAGDTVISVLSALAVAGLNLEYAVNIANIAAGISVSKAGTYCVSRKEILSNLDKHGIYGFFSKVMELDTLKRNLSKWKKENKKIVFTNGCFDILHAGHINYLNKASRLGSKLIVGINSDDSVRRLKGNERPIVSEIDRANILSALEFVDAVIIFKDNTPLNLIKLISPDVLVKGEDYEIENIVGREYAKETKVISFLKGYSTTGIVQKIITSVKGNDDKYE